MDELEEELERVNDRIEQLENYLFLWEYEEEDLAWLRRRKEKLEAQLYD